MWTSQYLLSKCRKNRRQDQQFVTHKGFCFLTYNTVATNGLHLIASFSTNSLQLCSPNIVVKPFFDNVDIPSNISLPNFVWQGAVENHGNKVAMIDGITGRQYTYNEAFLASKKFGSATRRLGLNKGDVVAFFLHNCPEYITGLTGVIGVGGVATTANPSYTATELTRQLEMSNSQMIVTTSNLISVATQAVKNTKRKILIIVLDTKIANTVFYQDVLHHEDGLSHLGQDEINFSKDDVVVLPYSSGTTGLPKGTILSSKLKVVNR